MSLITYLSPQPCADDIPDAIPSPFGKYPHPLAWRACEEFQQWLTRQSNLKHDFDADDGGKMMGVLVVRDQDGQIGFLSGFSGMLAGQWQLPGFVPPIFDQNQRDQFLPMGEAKLANLTAQIQMEQASGERRNLQVKLEQSRERRDVELAMLKEEHLRRKEKRRVMRQEDISDDKARNDLLHTLSRESQQDKRDMRNLRDQWAQTIEPIEVKLTAIEQDITDLKKARSRLSKRLQKQVFEGYVLKNRLGEEQAIASFFPDKLPPGGTGDCAGAKLLHYAIEHQLTPVAMAEFWWGALPKETIRHHGHYYPACRGKCHPILPFMLKGYNVLARKEPGSDYIDASEPTTVYEDEYLVVVNKPEGLLSVPGKQVEDSVLTRLQKRYPDATGPLLVHRLDLATSGLLLAAKNLKTHKSLQRQFIKRTIKKRYVAVLSKPISQDSGVIELPLRVDLDDRPRHMVCYQHGKPATTRWEVIERKGDTTRVYFYPETGRTHQLRIHAAHRDGLNAPIVGDELYGDKDVRLHLHAEYLRFTHPETGVQIEVSVPAPF